MLFHSALTGSALVACLPYLLNLALLMGALVPGIAGV
jgi:hypothetical protein